MRARLHNTTWQWGKSTTQKGGMLPWSVLDFSCCKPTNKKTPRETRRKQTKWTPTTITVKNNADFWGSSHRAKVVFPFVLRQKGSPPWKLKQQHSSRETQFWVLNVARKWLCFITIQNKTPQSSSIHAAPGNSSYRTFWLMEKAFSSTYWKIFALQTLRL